MKHQLSYIERWRTDEEAEALSRGTLFHSVMEAHYGKILEVGRKDLIAEDIGLAVKALLYEEGTGEQSERQELVEWMYTGYVEHFGLDDQWEIIGIEVPLEEPLLNRDGTPSRFVLSGTCDLVVRDKSAGGGLWIVDHKTCKSLPSKDFDLEDQTAIYTLLMRRAGYDIRGAIYNHCKTYRTIKPNTLEERFKRQITVRTDSELEIAAFEVVELMEEAYSNHERRSTPRIDVRGMSDGEVAAAYDAPRSPDGERCGWKCGFTEACIAGRKYGPEKTRDFLESTGHEQKDTKPGPTFNKKTARAA